MRDSLPGTEGALAPASPLVLSLLERVRELQYLARYVYAVITERTWSVEDLEK